MYRATCWTGFNLDSRMCDLIYLHRFLQRYLVMFKILTKAEVVAYPHRNATYTSITHLASDLSRVPKSTIVWYICKRLTSLPKWMESTKFQDACGSTVITFSSCKILCLQTYQITRIKRTCLHNYKSLQSILNNDSPFLIAFWITTATAKKT